MKKKAFVSIGHIVNDLEPFDHLGGSATYTAITATKLGYEAHIITKCSSGHKYLKDLQNKGIKVHLLPSSKNNITSFRNIYDLNGKRTQTVTEIQEPINLKDLLAVPEDILKGAIILVASVIGEVDMEIFPVLAKYGPLFVTLQGYLRRVGDGGKISEKVPESWDFLKSVKASILSEEDIGGNLAILEAIKKNSRLTVLTRSGNGSTVFAGKKQIFSKAMRLKPEQILDLTGAGDTYAGAFVIEYMKSSDLKRASKKANLMAGKKISTI